MLQPRQQQPANPEVISKILWVALTFSQVMYGAILFITGKISAIFVPSGDLLPIEYLALGANAIALVSFFLFKNVVTPMKDPQKRLSSFIICWALNEMIVVLAFAAVFSSGTGNGFLYVTNLAIGLTANVIMFPRK